MQQGEANPYALAAAASGLLKLGHRLPTDFLYAWYDQVALQLGAMDGYALSLVIEVCDLVADPLRSQRPTSRTVFDLFLPQGDQAAL
jgi:hypothetical protein